MCREEELIGLAQNGDREAFSRLVELHNDALRRFIANKLTNHYQHDIDDAIQETWLRLRQRIHTCDPRRAPFEAFLISNARIIVRRTQRHRSTREKRVALYGDEDALWQLGNQTADDREELRSRAVSLEDDFRSVFNTYPDLAESEAISPWNLGISVIFSRRAGKPHQIIVFNFNRLIYPARYPSESAAGARVYIGSPGRIVSELSDQTMVVLTNELKYGYEIDVGKQLRRDQIRPFEQRIIELDIGSEALRSYYRTNPESNVSNWSDRVRQRVERILGEEYYEIFFLEADRLISGADISSRRWG